VTNAASSLRQKHAIKDDPADLDEVRAIQQDMAALHEG